MPGRSCFAYEKTPPQGDTVSTHFRVSLLLQVEQEKQFTHQALLRADTTVRDRCRHS